MLHILGLDLSNVVTFKKLSVDFNNNLTYVRGLNLDSDRANPTSNGAGKSLMFSTLANVVYQSIPTSAKKRSKKDILKQKGSTVGLILKPSEDGPEYEILQTAKGYKIYQDGKDLEIRTTPLAEEFIRKLFPIPEITFYSTCYVSTQRPYLLQKDTDSNRLQHLTDIFNLDQYSGIRDVLAKKRRAVSDNEVKLSVLEQRVVTLRKKLAELKAPVSKAEYRKLKADYDKYTEQLEKVQAHRFDLLTTQRDLESLLKVEHTLDELRDKYEFKKPPAVMLKTLKAQKEASEIWDRYRHRVAQNNKLRKSMQEKLDALEVPEIPRAVVKKQIKFLKPSIEEASADIARLKSLKVQFDALTEKIDETTAALEANTSTPQDGVDYEAEIAILRSTLRLEKLIHNHDGESSECPTCLSELDMDSLKSTVKSAKKKLPKYEACAEKVRLTAKLASLETDRMKLHFSQDVYDRLRTQRAAHVKELEEMNAVLQVYRDRAAIEGHLAEIGTVKKPEHDEPKLSAEQIDSGIELCTSILDALSSKAVLTDNGSELADLRTVASVEKRLSKFKEQIETADAEVDKIRTRQYRAAETISNCEHFKNTNALYSRELKEAEAEIELLAPSVKDKRLLDILLKAYGAKGLRSKAAESVCTLLQTNLNHYRDLIFAEPFEFEVHSSETGVSIMVDRNNGKPDSVSDVRFLSGAESNCFQLLCLISLLPLLPNNCRLNIAVLDEPTAHMDEVSRQIFNSRFIPVLREVVPSVIVITPHSDDCSENSVEWLVQKEDGVSTLKVS